MFKISIIRIARYLCGSRAFCWIGQYQSKNPTIIFIVIIIRRD